MPRPVFKAATLYKGPKYIYIYRVSRDSVLGIVVMVLGRYRLYI